MTVKGSELWRTFCAVELPAVIRSQIQKHIESLRSTVPEAQPSWSRVDNIHLTMKFFGNVERRRVPVISEALSHAVNGLQQFEIAIAGAGAFPQFGQPRVLWIGINDTNKHLTELHSRIDEECSKKGFEKEKRDFRPHLTIARIRKPAGTRTLAEVNQRLGFESLSFLVSQLVLFRSELSSEGSKYTVISRHSF